MDFSGPLSTGEYMMVLIDDHSRYPQMEIIHSTPPKVVIAKLEKIFAAQVNPTEIRTDNGLPFNGHGFKEYAKLTGVHHRKVTPL